MWNSEAEVFENSRDSPYKNLLHCFVGYLILKYPMILQTVYTILKLRYF